jgi:NADPH:quinone reductase-like Zn-dependent oxidoreductase
VYLYGIVELQKTSPWHATLLLLPHKLISLRAAGLQDSRIMKAIVYKEYGPVDVLQLVEVDKPVPGDDEVLVRIYAAAVSSGDCEMRRFEFPAWLWLPLRLMMGVFRPRYSILGSDLAGEIEAAGKDVTECQVGDQVYATTTSFGAHAEYKCLPGRGPMASKPANMTFAEAASVPTGAYNALHFLHRADIRPGQKLLINGAAGGIGVMAIQLARHFGAQVTAVDSTGKLEVMRSLGAEHVIDYTREDFTSNGEVYDVILDVHGKSPFGRCIRSLSSNGCYLLANPRFLSILRGLWTSWTSSRKVVFAFAAPRADDLDFVRQLIEAGEIKAVVDRVYPLTQAAEAHAYIETGQKKGNVVLSIRQDD